MRAFRKGRDERGAVAVFTAAITVLLLGVSAFAVDLGMQRVARRDMQAIADIVALDLGRLLNGRTRGEIEAGSVGYEPLATALSNSLDRNESAPVGRDLEVDPYLVDLVDDDGDGIEDDYASGADGLPVQVASGEIPDAVVVVSSTQVDFGFARAIGVDSGGATRSAIAASEESGCFRVATMALALATGNSAILNGILGDALDIGVLGYNGLANANVSLLGLEAALVALDPDGVVDLENVSLGDLVLASAQVLENTPGHDTADVALLEAIHAQLQAADEDGTIINVAEMLALSQGVGSAAMANVNLLDVLSGAAFIANGTNAIAVPGLTLGIPGVTTTTARLFVTERPQRGCRPGDSTAQTSQVKLELTVNLNLSVPLVASLTGELKVTLDLAQATAQLRRITCAQDGTPESMRIAVTSQQLARTVVELNNLTARALLGILVIPLLDADPITTTQPSPEGVYDVPLPQHYEPNPFATPGSYAGVPNLASGDLTLLGLNLGSLVSPVLQLLNPVLDAVDSLVTNVLSPALGLRVTGVDLFGVETPVCAGSSLVG